MATQDIGVSKGVWTDLATVSGVSLVAGTTYLLEHHQDNVVLVRTGNQPATGDTGQFLHPGQSSFTVKVPDAGDGSVWVYPRGLDTTLLVSEAPARAGASAGGGGSEPVTNVGPSWGTVDFTAGSAVVNGTDIITTLSDAGTAAGISEQSEDYWILPRRAPTGTSQFRISTWRDTATPTQADPNPDPVWEFGDDEVINFGASERGDEGEWFISIGATAAQRRGTTAIGAIRVNYDSTPGTGDDLELLRFRKNPAGAVAFPKCQVRVEPIGVFGAGVPISSITRDNTLRGDGASSATALRVANPFTDDDETKLDALDIRSFGTPTLANGTLVIPYVDGAGGDQNLTANLTDLVNLFTADDQTKFNALDLRSLGQPTLDDSTNILTIPFTDGDGDAGSVTVDLSHLAGGGTATVDAASIYTALTAQGVAEISTSNANELASIRHIAVGLNGDGSALNGQGPVSITPGALVAYLQTQITSGTTVGQGEDEPTGGSAGDLYVRWGATQPGIWYNDAGTWGLILAVGGGGTTVVANPSDAGTVALTSITIGGTVYTIPSAGTQGEDGDHGWSPLLAVDSDGERRILELVGWTGGEGHSPGIRAENALKRIGLVAGLWTGGVSDGTTAWIINDTTNRAEAYRVSDRNAFNSLDIDLGAGTWTDAATNGTYLWFVDNATNHARAWDTAGVRQETQDIDLGAGSWVGAACDGTTLWFVNNTANLAQAVTAATRANDNDKNITLGDGTWNGAVSDGPTVWFINDAAPRFAVAYEADSQDRDEDKDIALPDGVWGGGASDGETVWLVNDTANNVPAFDKQYGGDEGFVFEKADATDLRGSVGGAGNRGWSPRLAVVTDGARRVLQVHSWEGGQGSAPDSGVYLGATGFVNAVANGVDIRGPAGSGGGSGGTPDNDSVGLAQLAHAGSPADYGKAYGLSAADGTPALLDLADASALNGNYYNGSGATIHAGRLVVEGGALPTDIQHPVGLRGDDPDHTTTAVRSLNKPLGIATHDVANQAVGAMLVTGIRQKDLGDDVTFARGDTVFVIQSDPEGTGDREYYKYTNIRTENTFAVGKVVQVPTGQNPIVAWDFTGDTFIAPDHETSFSPTQENLYDAVKSILHPDEQDNVSADDTNHEIDLSISDQFAPTKANLYAHIKEILHPDEQDNVAADDANNEIDFTISDQFSPTKANLYAHIKEIFDPDNTTGLSADDSNNEIDLELTKQALYAGVKAILHPDEQTTVTADDANFELDIVGTGGGSGSGSGDIGSELVGSFSFAATASLTAVDTGINLSALTEEFLAVNFGDDTGAGNILPGEWQIIRREELTGRAHTSVGDLVQNDDNKWRRFSTPQSGGDGDPSLFYLGISSAGNVMIAAQDSSEDALPFVVRRITGGGGTTVVANPSSVGDDDLTSITIGVRNYRVASDDVIVISSTDDLPEPTTANENKIILRVGTKAEILIQDITGHHITAPVGTFTPLIPRQAPHAAFWGYSRPANPSENEFYYDHQHRRWEIYESTPYQDEFGQEQTRLEWAASYDITELGGAFDDDSVWLGDFETEVEALHHFPGGTYDDSKTYYAFIGGNDRWAGQVRQLQSTPTPTPGGARIELRSWERVALSHEVADVIHKLSINGLGFRSGSTQAPVINIPPQWFMGVDEDYIDNVSTALNAAGGLLEGDLHIGPELSQGYHVLSYRRASIATPADDYLGTANGVGTGTVLQLRYVNGSALEWVSCRVLRPPMPFTDTSVPGRFTIHVEAETKQGAGIAAFANQDLVNVHVSVHTPEERILPLAQLSRSVANSVRFHTFTNTHPPDIDRNDIDEFLVEVMVSQSDGSPAGATLVRIMRPWEHSSTQSRIVPGNFPSQVPFSWDVADVARLSTGEATRQASESASRGAGVIEYNNTAATAGLEYRFRVDAGAEINSSYGVAYRLSAVVRKGGTLARRW